MKFANLNKPVSQKDILYIIEGLGSDQIMFSSTEMETTWDMGHRKHYHGALWDPTLYALCCFNLRLLGLLVNKVVACGASHHFGTVRWCVVILTKWMLHALCMDFQAESKDLLS